MNIPTNIILDLFIKCEYFKSIGSLYDYTIDSSIENMSVASDGVLEYDKNITVKVIPKKTIEYIDIIIKIEKND